MEENNSLHIAYWEDVVYVRGEVFVPSAVLYKKGAGKDHYIRQAGDFKEDADQGRLVVFMPGGKKWESSM